MAIAVLGPYETVSPPTMGADPYRRRESVGRPPIVMQVDLEGGRQNQQIQVDMTKEMMKERTTAQDIKRMDSGTILIATSQAQGSAGLREKYPILRRYISDYGKLWNAIRLLRNRATK